MRKIPGILCFLLLPMFLQAQITAPKELVKRGHEVLCLAYSPNGQLMATGGTDNHIYIWNLTTGANELQLDTRKWPRTLCFSADGKSLVSGGKDQRLKRWNLQTGELLYAQKAHREQIVSLDISSDNKYIATGGADGKVVIWDYETGKTLKELTAHKGNVNAVCFHPNAKHLATGSADKYIIEWDIPTGRQIRKFKAHKSWIRALAYHPEGTLLASAGDDKNIILWKKGKQINSFLAHRDWIQTLAFSPDGKYLASGGHDKNFLLWELNSGKILYKQTLTDKVMDVVFRPDGQFMAAADFSHRVPVWSTKSLDIQPITYAAKRSNIIPEKKANTNKSYAHKDSEKPQLRNKIPIKGETTSNEHKSAESLNSGHKEEHDSLQNAFPNKPSASESLDKKIDVDLLPSRHAPINPNRYALIIGNEDYSSFQLNLQKESNVDFAVHDATVFKKYAKTILGIPEENIIFLANARAIQMHRAINKMNMIGGITGGTAEFFFYYAGHGLPNEKTKEPCLIPVDVSGADLAFALSLREVYKKLTEHPTQQVTVILDACFSGGARNQGLVAARGVKIQPQKHILRGNIVVFAASSGTESSLPYHDKNHGIFTYYLLKKLKETQGRVNYREMSDYLYQQVGVRSVLINSIKQTPATNVSVDLEDTWGQLQWVN